MSDYDVLVRDLIAKGAEPARAHERAAVLYPHEAQQLGDDAERKANVRELEEQRVIWKMALACGFKGYWLSQSRAAKQTPGLPDLWFTHRKRSLALWWETKRQVGGKRSQAQIEFGEECIAAGVCYGFGDRFAFGQWLMQAGFDVPPIPQ